MSKIAFSQNIGAWQGELTIDINEPFASSEYAEGDLIKVIVFDNANPSGRQIYFWQVSKLGRIQDLSSQLIRLTCLWIHYITNNVFIIQSGYNADPWDIIKILIDMINAKYPGALLSYAGGNIQNYWSNIQLWFNQIYVSQAIQRVIDAIDWYYFFIDAEGEVYFQPKPVSPTHNLTNQKDTENIALTNNIETVKNAIVVRFIDFISINWVPFYDYVTADDISSQTANWYRELYEDGSWFLPVWDTAEAQAYANARVSELTNIKKDTTIIVNDNYDITSILPGHTIKILNFDYSITNLQVLKTNYNGTSVTLTIDRLFTFASAVNW